jgi:PAS domain S-box-containing protein
MVGHYKAIVEELNEGLLISKVNRILFANETFASMHGVLKEEVLKKNPMDFVAPESQQEFRDSFLEKLNKLPPSLRLEYLRLHKDGRRIPTEIRAKAISLGHGQAFVGVCLDQTDRKQSEKELRQVKEFCENVLSSSYDSITVIDQEGLVVYLSPASERITHYKMEELIGKSLSITYKDKELFREKLEFINKTKAPISYEVVVIDREGGEHILSVSRSPLKDVNGNCIGSVGVCKDITERKLREEQDQERQRLADIGQLTTLLAHEMRNPLSSVKMNVQILSKKLHLSGNNRRRMEIIDSEIKRMEFILGDVLNFAKPLKLSLNPEDVNEIIAGVLDTVDEKIMENQIVVERDLSKCLPKILLDRQRIAQAILNVVLNAIDAMNLNGGGCLRVITESGESLGEKIVKIGISDNGIGIEEKDLKNIFRPFYSGKLQGTGLGLTIVKKIIDAHGGLVQVDSQLGRGTLVNLFLKEE